MQANMPNVDEYLLASDHDCLTSHVANLVAPDGTVRPEPIHWS